MTEKVIGYFLIFIGVATLFITSLNAFNILTKKQKPIEFINKETVSSITPSKNENPVTLNQVLNIDTETITLITNLGIHLLMLSFIMKAGFHLASLGTMLLRPIVVDVNTKKGN